MSPRRLRQRATASICVAPLFVSDLTAPIAVGLEPRQFRDLVRDLEIPHIVYGQRLLVEAEDLRAALAVRASSKAIADYDARSPEAREYDEPQSVDAVLARLGRRRISGASQ